MLHRFYPSAGFLSRGFPPAVYFASARPETVYFADAGVARASAMLIYAHVNCASRNPRALAPTK